MKYIRGYKFRLYPNKEQKILLNKTLGCCRFVFNHFLNVRRETLENEKKSVSYNDTSALMTQLKTDEERKNRNRQRIRLARIHEKIANTRRDFLHKLTTELCRENQTIAVETLNEQ